MGSGVGIGQLSAGRARSRQSGVGTVTGLGARADPLDTACGAPEQHLLGVEEGGDSSPWGGKTASPRYGRKSRAGPTSRQVVLDVPPQAR